MTLRELFEATKAKQEYEWGQIAYQLHWLIASTSGKVVSIDRLNPTVERKESGEYETAETLRAEYEEYKRLEEEKRQRKKK